MKRNKNLKSKFDSLHPGRYGATEKAFGHNQRPIPRKKLGVVVVVIKKRKEKTKVLYNSWLAWPANHDPRAESCKHIWPIVYYVLGESCDHAWPIMYHVLESLRVCVCVCVPLINAVVKASMRMRGDGGTMTLKWARAKLGPSHYIQPPIGSRLVSIKTYRGWG